MHRIGRLSLVVISTLLLVGCALLTEPRVSVPVTTTRPPGGGGFADPADPFESSTSTSSTTSSTPEDPEAPEPTLPPIPTLPPDPGHTWCDDLVPVVNPPGDAATLAYSELRWLVDALRFALVEIEATGPEDLAGMARDLLPAVPDGAAYDDLEGLRGAQQAFVDERAGELALLIATASRYCEGA